MKNIMNNITIYLTMLRNAAIYVALSFIVQGRGASSFHSQSAFSLLRPNSVHETLVLKTKIELILNSSVSNDETTSEAAKKSKRAKFLNVLGFKRLENQKKDIEPVTSLKQVEEKVEITTLEELNAYFEDPDCKFRIQKKKGQENDDSDNPIDYKALLSSISVKGDTQTIGSKDQPEITHPVLQLLQERRRNNSKPVEGKRTDGFKVALAIEGGGMRGCVSAGMVVAIDYLGLRECFDVVYGSSAGSLIGSYFLTKQLPWFGPELYYDSLTTAGNKFIDSKRLLRAVGLGLVDPRLLKDVITRPTLGKPVLDLDFLLKYTAIERKPLDWGKFEKLQKTQPLKVVASGLKSEKAIVLDYENGSFDSLFQLTECMHASMLLPGIAGPVINMCKDSDGKVKFIRGQVKDKNCEPLVDALVYEPLPYRSALQEGATHVVVLRTRADGVDTTGKPSVFERLIFRRFFLRKNKLGNVFKRMTSQLHKKLYAEDMIILNEASNDFERDYTDTSYPHMMAVALPPGSEEVTRLETGREAILEGVRRGFARAYDTLVEDSNERGRGSIVAKEVFPDKILEYDPLQIDERIESAFSAYLRQVEKTKINV